MKQVVILTLSLLLLLSCNKDRSESCNGNTRREIKLMIDDLASTVDTAVIDISIKEIGQIEVPEVKKETPRQDVEKKVYRVTGTINKIKQYRDGDIHIRLDDGNDNYIITEIPNPGCVYAASASMLNEWNQAISFVKANGFEDLEGKTVTITGVAFVDIDHHYKRKQAENNMELHPIIKIEF